MPDGVRTVDDVIAAVVAEQRELRHAVEALSGRLARLEAREVHRHDPRLPAFLRASYAFSGAAPWTAGELIADARQAGRRDLLAVVDAIVGDSRAPAVTLGRWLEGQRDVECGELHLVRVKRERGSWLYGVMRG